MDKMKNKALSFLKKDIVVSIIFTLLAYGITFLLSGFRMYYSTNDDYFVAHSIATGDTFSIFISCFLFWILAPLQQWLPNTNVFMLSELVLCFMALVVINYVFIKRCSQSKIFYIVVWIINLIVMPSLSVFLQWTQTATILAAAGYFLIISVFKYDVTKIKKIISVLVGAGFLIISSWYRMSALYAVTLIVAVYLCSDILIFIWKVMANRENFVAAMKKCLKKYVSIILVFSAVFLIVFCGGIMSDYIKTSSELCKDFKEFNSARSSVIDYGAAPYESNEEFYNNLDIYSPNDITVFGSWNVDDDFFTVSKLKQIADYSSDSEFGNRFSFSYLYGLLENKINSLGVNTYHVLGIVAIGGLLSLIGLFVFKEKLKWVFPTALIFGWLLILLVLRGQIANHNLILALPVVALVIITGFVFNRYHYLGICMMSAILVALTIYFNFSRISYRVVYSFFVPAIFAMFYLIDVENIRKKYQSTMSTKIIVFVGTIILLVVSAITGFCNFRFGSKEIVKNPLETYVSEHSEKNYVIDFQSMLKLCKNYYIPLRTPELYDNTLVYAGWYANSPYFNKQKQTMGMEHVFEDMIDNDSVFYVIDEKDFDILLQYFNDHYAEEGKDIEFDIIDTIETANICEVKIVSK